MTMSNETDCIDYEMRLLTNILKRRWVVKVFEKFTTEKQKLYCPQRNYDLSCRKAWYSGLTGPGSRWKAVALSEEVGEPEEPRH